LITLVGAVPGASRSRVDQAGVTAVGLRVVDDGTDRPIAGARIVGTRLAGTAQSTGRVVTDENGHAWMFVSGQGTLRLQARHRDYLDGVHGALNAADDYGTPIAVRPSAILSDVTIRLRRPNSISGQVIDEFGEPMAGVPVTAYRRRFEDGQFVFLQQAAAATDDRGAFRITDLPQGSYLVGFVPLYYERDSSRTQPPADDAPEPFTLAPDRTLLHAGFSPIPGARLDSGGSWAYAPAFYPDGGTRDARLLAVVAGDHLGGILLAPRVTPVARVVGQVAVANGTLGQATVALSRLPKSDTFPLSKTHIGDIAPDGRFGISFVPYGEYEITLDGLVVVDGVRRPIWFRSTVTVDERTPREELHLTARSGLTVRGRFREAGSTAPPNVDLASAVATLSHRSEPGAQLRSAGSINARNAGAGFVFNGLVPRRYVLGVNGLPGGWHVLSGILGGTDVYDAGLRLSGDTEPGELVISLTRSLGVIEGLVRDAAGEPVLDGWTILFPADPATWTPGSRRIRGIRAATDGSFGFAGLPPDDYLLITTSAERYQWYDPAFLATLAPQAMPVRVGDDLVRVEIRAR